jgi:energy-coupling factor transporter ATP-binding protein EcfA2
MTSNALSRLATLNTGNVIVLDGHDGAGKSTLVRLLQQRLGGVTVKPFNDSLGDLLVWLIAEQRFDLANQLALQSVEKGLNCADGDGLRWFDRHWLSLFTLLPESCWEAWMPLPPTVLCWANPEVTVQRLVARGEPAGDMEEHRYFCQRYRDLAERFGVPVVDTSETTPEEAIERVLPWLR